MNLIKTLKLSFAILALSTIFSCKSDDVPDVGIMELEGRGEITDHTLIASYTTAEVNDILDDTGDPLIAALTPVYEIDLYKVIYKTPDVWNENITTASGLVVVPKNVGQPSGIASYQHGTTLKKVDVPSYLASESRIGMIYASINGLVMSMPDYLGLGDGPGFHPYVHAPSEATATIDMLRATKELCGTINIDLNEKLLLFGYSQGGHATMATHKEIEENHATEFTVTASAPLAGPYDMSGYQADVFMVDEEYAYPYYLPYVLLSYNYAYELYDSPSEFLASPYDVTLPPLFDGLNTGGAVNDAMPSYANDIILPSVLNDFRYNYSHPFRTVLRENDLYDWTPKAPTLICHCEGDDQVKYENALVAYNTFITNGATDVRFSNKGNLDHNDCAPLCFLETLNFFSEFLN